jgi:hypothetical protein
MEKLRVKLLKNNYLTDLNTSYEKIIVDDEDKES